MNQYFTEKKALFVWKKKILAEGFTWKKIRAQVVSKKKKFLQPENSPPPPITFLMVRPLVEKVAS